MGFPRSCSRISGIRYLRLLGLVLIFSWLLPENQGACQEAPKITPKKVPELAPRLDLLGDALPPGAIARLGTLRLRHPGGSIDSVAFSPDGSLVVSGGKDQSVRLWCTKTGKQVGKFLAPDNNMSVAVFSPNGNLLATGGFDGIVRLWEVASGKETYRWVAKPQRSIYSLIFSRDSRFLAAGLSESVCVWNVDGHHEVFRFSCQGNVKAIAFTPDGKTLVTASDDQRDKALRFWQVPSGKENREQIVFDQQIHSISICPNGKALAAAIWRDGVTVRDLATGKETLKVPEAGNLVAFSPNGKSFVALKNGKRLCLWDIANGNLVREFSGHHSFVRCLSFSHDGTMLATGGSGALRIWDVSSGKEKVPYHAHEGVLRKAEFSWDGTRLMTGCSWGLFLWEISTGKLLSEFPVLEGRFSLRPDAKAFAVSNSIRLGVWQMPNGKPLWESPIPGDYCWNLSYSPDGKSIVWGGKAGRVFLWDSLAGSLTRELLWPWTAREQIEPAGLIDGKYVPLPEIQTFAFSANGQFLAASGKGKNIHVWRCEGGKSIRRLPLPSHPQGGITDVNSLTMSSDGRFLAAGVSYHGASVWNVTSGKSILEIPGTRCSVTALSRNGKYLATGGDNIVRLWEVTTGQEICERSGHLDRINSLCFSADGHILVSTSFDQTALVWDLRQLPNLMANAHLAGLTNQELAQYWADLNKNDAKTAYRAIQTLRQHPKQTVQFLKTHLRPAPASDVEPIRKQIHNLDSDDFTVRENAYMDLRQLGRQGETELRGAQEKELSDEHRQRINSLIDELEKAPLPPEHLRQTRAIQLLEQVTTAQARQVLESLARGGAWAQTTQDALGALERLHFR